MGKNVLMHVGEINNLKFKNKIPAKINLLSPVTNKSITFKATKNTIMDKFASKQLHEVFEEYVNAE